eukprot:snap_masked-scaffold_9-processed-gene-2.54-mRNA-1 protein AED:1.00 eAED:1.00 QI:0/0/0/0/1/1/2/0/69
MPRLRLDSYRNDNFVTLPLSSLEFSFVLVDRVNTLRYLKSCAEGGENIGSKKIPKLIQLCPGENTVSSL